MTNIADMAMSSRSLDRKKMPGCGNPTSLGAADWLRLAAAPTFAIMALLTGLFGSGPMPMICSAGASFLNGMVPMYMLMSVFHSAPWLKLIAKRSDLFSKNAALYGVNKRKG
jgi:hypothetical protein